MNEIWQTYAIINFKNRGDEVRIDNVTDVTRRSKSILLITKSHKLLIPISLIESLLVITDKVDLKGCVVRELETKFN